MSENYVYIVLTDLESSHAMEDDWVHIHNDEAAFSAARTTAFVVVDAEREGAANAEVEDVAGDTTAESEAYGDLPSVDGHGIAATTFHAREYHNIEFDDAYFRDEGIHGCEALNGNGGTKSNSPKLLQSIYDNYKLYDKQYGNIYINTGGRHEGTVAHGSNDGTHTGGGRAGAAHNGNGGTKSNSPKSLQSIYDNYKLYDKHYGSIYINTGGRHGGTVARVRNDSTHTGGGHAGAAHGSNGSTKSNSAKMIPSAHDNTEFYDTYRGGMYISNESEHGDEADSICSDIESNSPQEFPSTYDYSDFDDMLPSACYDTEFYGAYCGDMYISNESEHGDEAESICSDIESNSPQELPSTYDYNDFEDMLPSACYDTEFYGAYCGDMYINNEGRHDGAGGGSGNDGTKSNLATARTASVVLIPPARRRTADMYGTPVVYGYGYPLDGHVPLFMSMMPSYSYVTMYADATLHVHSLHAYSYIVQL